MEKLENDIIRHKLNGLDSLPQGYNPSLESKFDLLMAGTEKPARRKIVWWPQVAAAASLLLVSLWWINNRNQEPVQAHKTFETHEPAKSLPQTIAPVEKQNIAVNLAHNASAKYKARKKTIAVQQSPEPIPVPEVVLPVAQNTSLPVNATPSPDTLQTTAQARVIAKKRYTEFDFNEGAQAQTPTTSTVAAGNKSRFRIGLSSVADNNTAPAVKSALRLQQNF